MALTEQRKRELDAMMQQSGGISAERKAQLDQAIAQVKQRQQQQQVSAGEIAKGFGKGILSDIKGASELGEKIITGLGRIITPKPLEEKLGFAKPEVSSAQKLQTKAETTLGIDQGSLTEATTKGQKIGKTAETIAAFAAPSGAAFRAGKALQAVPKVAQAGRVARGLAGIAPQVATDVGVELARTGGDVKESLKTGALSAGTLGAFGALGAAGRGVSQLARKGIEKSQPIKSVFGRTGAEVLGKTTGAGTKAIEEAFTNPKVVEFARQAKGGTVDLLDDALENTRGGLSKLLQKRAKDYRQQLSNIKTASVFTTSKLKPTLNKSKQYVKTLGDDLDTIVEGRGVVNKAISDVSGWTDTSVKGMDTLKRRLGSYERQLNAPGKAPAKRIVSELKSRIREGLEENVKGYKKLTSEYSKTSDLIDEVTKALSLRKGNQRETAIRKLLQTIRRDDDTRNSLLKQLEEITGEPITAQISGALLAPKSPRGLAGALTPSLGGIAGLAVLANPSSWPLAILYLASSSPRLVAEFLNIVGNITPEMTKSKQIPKELIDRMNQILKSAIVGSQSEPNQ